MKRQSLWVPAVASDTRWHDKLINEGWTVGVAARRIEKLTDLQNSAPERVFTAQIDVTEEHADASLSALITQMDGIDLYLHVARIGWQNPSL